VRANCPHGFVATTLLTTDSPLTAHGGYSGEAAIPKRGHQEGTLAPPHSQDRFVIDLSAWCIPASRERRGTFTGQCYRPL